MTAPALRTEIVAGVTTFLTMAYVVVVNPRDGRNGFVLPGGDDGHGRAHRRDDEIAQPAP